MTTDELFDEAALRWRDNKGVGTILVPAPIDDRAFVYHILTIMYGKNKYLSTLIIVNDFAQRTNIIEFLTNQENEENNVEFKKLIADKFIRIFTTNFVSNNGWVNIPTLCIIYKPEDYNRRVEEYFPKCKFRLVVLNNLLTNQNDISEIYKVAPILSCFKQQNIDELRVSSPVEDMWIPVDINKASETWKLYEHYSKFIETALNIFGSFEMIQKARTGDQTLNISAATICTQIAEENGWNEHLDMSYEFNVKLDELYNPNNLQDMARQTYETIRNRNNLLSDYEDKLEKILEVVKEHLGDKILIINKRGEFANKVTEYINSNFDTDICGNYHNKVDVIPAVDVYDNPVFVKSGKEKGKRKTMSSQAQMTLNEKKFNMNKLCCLSLSSSPDKSLNVDVDIIIITSPLCEDIQSYLYRLSNLNIRNGKIKLFSIFCRNTIEQKKLLNKNINENHIFVNKDEIMTVDENNFDFIIAD